MMKFIKVMLAASSIPILPKLGASFATLTARNP
jgi:hypothetical protein